MCSFLVIAQNVVWVIADNIFLDAPKNDRTVLSHSSFFIVGANTWKVSFANTQNGFCEHQEDDGWYVVDITVMCRRCVGNVLASFCAKKQNTGGVKPHKYI